MILRFADSKSENFKDIEISNKELIEYIDSMAYERLLESECGCNPVGETNVIECNCDEVAYEKYENFYLSEVF